MKKIYIDRSRHLDHSRCPRLRWLGYHAGSQHRGLQPVRKSIHLVIGGAVHAGLEVLLREGEEFLRWFKKAHETDASREYIIGVLFDGLEQSGKGSHARLVEQHAVDAALAELASMTKLGVELDMNEQAGTQQAVDAASGVKIDFSGATDSAGATANGFAGADSPIMIDFGGCDTAASSQPAISFGDALDASVKLERESAGEMVDWSKPIYENNKIEVGGIPAGSEESGASGGHVTTISAQVHEQANQQAATGIDSYLKDELAALVEGMVRAYARRRLRPLLEQFEVLEVEREGQWKLGEIPQLGEVCQDEKCDEPIQHAHRETWPELWFMSRLDALLLERSTNSLYLQSYKTTGQWDRRKAAEAEIDMQGLSEAVDVELRLAEAWKQVMYLQNNPSQPVVNNVVIGELVDSRVAEWLKTQSAPPRVLGVRYEYLIKGPRRQDDKDAQLPGRYVFDSPLIRTYSQAGITADDRRWAASYSYYNLAGQNKRLDYRSWQKVPVWRYMSIAAWIDLLDAGKVQPEAYDKDGRPMDVLAEQFVAPVHVYRNSDSMLDMLEQLEASEVRIAQDVAACHAVEHDASKLRSELNKRFPQTLTACTYPGACSYKPICFGGEDIRRNPEMSELYTIRSVANHPIEFQEVGQ